MSADEVRGHEFDGIEEYDNRLPNWWLWTFFGAILFSVFYWLHYHVLETGPSSKEEYEAQLAAVEEASGPKLDHATLLAMSKDPEVVKAGREVFMGPGICFSCHGPNAGGMPNLGLNLTDDHWKHGPHPMQIYHTVRYGVEGTSMVANQALGKTRTMQVVAYVLSLANTNVSGGQPAEGKPSSEWGPPPQTLDAVEAGR